MLCLAHHYFSVVEENLYFRLCGVMLSLQGGFYFGQSPTVPAKKVMCAATAIAKSSAGAKFEELFNKRMSQQ